MGLSVRLVFMLLEGTDTTLQSTLPAALGGVTSLAVPEAADSAQIV